MGVLNVTPDSFSDGGEFFDDGDRLQTKALERLHELASSGAEIVDIGGESTKPGGDDLDQGSEWRRIEGVVKASAKVDSICVSVDTYHVDTARRALACGANVVNDVRCTWHFPEMASVVGDFGGHLIVVHNSRNDTNFAGVKDPIAAIITEFERILHLAESINFDWHRIILDPGIGFGKTTEQNLEIFRKIDQICGRFPNPVLCGTSRKSFLRETCGSDDPATLDGATVATTAEGFRRGCKIFRVHNVAGNLAALKFARKLYE
jgi:dihydropteroate synthase